MIKKIATPATANKDFIASSGPSRFKEKETKGAAGDEMFGLMLHSAQGKEMPKGKLQKKGKVESAASGKGNGGAEGTKTKAKAQKVKTDEAGKPIDTNNTTTKDKSLKNSNAKGISASLNTKGGEAKKSSAGVVLTKNESPAGLVKTAAMGQAKKVENVAASSNTPDIKLKLVKTGKAEGGETLKKAGAKLQPGPTKLKTPQKAANLAPVKGTGEGRLLGEAAQTVSTQTDVEGQKPLAAKDGASKLASPKAAPKNVLVNGGQAKPLEKGVLSPTELQRVIAKAGVQAGDEGRPALAGQKGKAGEVIQKQQKLHNSLLGKGNAGGLQEKEMLIHTILEEQARQKQDQKRLPSFVSLEQQSGKQSNSGTHSLGMSYGSVKLPGTFQPINSGTGSQAGNQNMVWESIVDSSSFEIEDADDAEKQAASRMKLAQSPVANISLRRKVLPALTRKVTTAASQGSKSPNTWQKHNFTLDDGKEIQLSARQGKGGVLHLKLGSLQADLSRLLQQHQQQIREHLEQECGTEIDLQLNNGEGQQGSLFSDDSSPRMQGRSQRTGHRNGLAANNQSTSGDAANPLMQTVRRFGYNRTEWIA